MRADKTHQMTNILIIDSYSGNENSLELAIPDLLYRFKKAQNLDSASEALRTGNYAVVLLKLEQNDLESLKILKKSHHGTDIIVMIDAGNQSFAPEALNAGATDYLLIPFSSDILHAKIKALCEIRRKDKELLMLRQQVAMNYAFDNFIGLSPAIEKIRKTVQQVSPTDVQVVLSGLPGCGKDLLAKIIHYHSHRRERPFVALDCSTIPTNQLETDLFGTAVYSTESTIGKGIFERAEKGTVFIDQLHLLELPLQSRLAHFLEQNSSCTSATKEGKRTDFRLIISMNEPLYNLVRKGIVHEQLARHLNAVEITLPSLAGRTEDIHLLTAYCLRKIAFENDSAPLTISRNALEKLKQHQWPGNVRELENCLRRASALCNNNCLDEEDITFVTTDAARTIETKTSVPRENEGASLADNQKLLITRALVANNWNYTQTAQQLGIGRTTLWRKVRKFALKRDRDENLQKMGVTADEQRQ